MTANRVRSWTSLLAVVGLCLLPACGAGTGAPLPEVPGADGPPTQPLAAQIWFVIADAGGGNGGNDWLFSVDITQPVPQNGQTAIGTGTGTNTIEGAAFWPGGDTLYAFNPDRLGTIDLTSGVWTQVVNRDVWDDGGGNLSGLDAVGSPESVVPSTLSDIDSAAFDPLTGTGYAVARVSGADMMFIFDTGTGRIVRGALNVGGTAYDYLRVPPVVPGNTDIDDIAIDPYDGRLYGIANGGGLQDRLVEIHKQTAAVRDVGFLGVHDMEGFAFYNDGSAWGTTGSAGPIVADRNSIWSIDPVTGVAYDRRPLVAGGGDFESIAFLTGDLNRMCGRVWTDTDGDGIQDPGEPGRSNVTLVLWRDVEDNDVLDAGTDIALVTTTTDANGDYCFSVASMGDFVITVKADTLPPDETLTSADVQDASVVGIGQLVTGLDFVLRPATGSIGDTVWLDADGDGVHDVTEAGIRDVAVDLLDPGPDGVCGGGDDIFIASTTTDGGGYYVFANQVDGNYCVDVDEATLPAGAVLTTGNEPYPAGIAGGSNDLAADFGYVVLGSIGDLVWLDLDGDGVVDPGEPPLAGVDVTLASAGPDGIKGNADDVTIGTLVTGADGSYGFAALPAGCYIVTVDVTDLPGGVNLTTVANPRPVLLDQSQQVVDADFGFAGTGQIGDLVWNDLDADGVLDAGETGLDGVAVNLIEAGPDGTLGTADDLSFPPQVTASGGNYAFAGLPAGAYRVDVDQTTLPAGFGTLTTGNDPMDLVLPAGGTFLTADFGYVGYTASIGDRIWDDVDGDGVDDVGELGLVGVDVDLTEAGPDGLHGTADDVSVGTATTAAGGAYDITSLPPGNYRVDVDEASLPAGVSLTTGNEPLDVVLAAAQDYDAADFGYWNPGSIGDVVWNDLDGDGLEDFGEPGIGGVTVTLTEAGPDTVHGTADDVLVGSQVTAGDGSYLFPGLPSGDYRVDVDDASVPGGFVTTTSNDPLDHLLTPGEDFTDADFGYWQPSSIGDRVWDDMNGDGVDDPGEPGLGGVTVALTEAGPDGILSTADDVAAGSQVTAGDGSYGFANLPGGLYRVDVVDGTLPAGYQNTTGNDPLDLPLPPGLDFVDADFGYWLAASLGDRVFTDLDGNGVDDAGEPGLGGVTLDLTEAGSDGLLGTPDDVAVGSQASAADGSYLFAGLPPGLYRVSVNGATVPASMALTTGNDPFDVTLSPGDATLNADFGFRHTARIGDLVWDDLNGDGVVDPGESGLPGVTVNLSNAGPDGVCGTPDDVALPSTVTAADGSFHFENLPGGTYCVEVDDTTLPAGYVPTTLPALHTIPIAPGQDFADADFGFRQEGAIGDRVWQDFDEDGAEDPGEPGIVGVTLDLLFAGPDGSFGTADDVALPPETTIAGGAYLFTGLAAGTYRVTVDAATLPPGMALTTGNLPLDVTLLPGQGLATADFGYQFDGSIGDLVWQDLDENGAQDPGEPGLGGVTVNMVEAGSDATLGTPDDVPFPPAVTAADGSYAYAQLPPGLYRLTVDGATVPAGMVLTTGNQPLDVNLAPSQDFATADFGYQFAGEIGDVVYEDTNGNAAQDPGEPGLTGVTLNLFEAGADGALGTPDDVAFPSDVTDGAGAYAFAQLPPGLYRVTVDGATVPAGMGLTTGNLPFDANLAPAQVVDTADFGYRHQGAIGDVVFDDQNGNGVQDPGEPGLVGVTLDLVEAGVDGLLGTADDVVIGSDVTDGTGAYDFAALPPGLYRVTVDGATLPPGVALTTGNLPFDQNLAPAQTVDTADFGYRHQGAIGDLVFDDVNGNGVQDPGEPGLAGVTLDLVEAGVDGVLGTGDDVAVASDVTDGTGSYGFANLPPGLYRVTVDGATVPAGMALTTGNLPFDQALAPAQVVDTADFGFQDQGAIGDRVWEDQDGNGVQDPGEPVLVNATLDLVEAGVDGTFGTADDVAVASDVTDGTGAYGFTALPPGLYRVTVDGTTLPAGMGLTTGNLPFDVTLAPAQVIDTADFGYRFGGSIGDRVYDDANGNGVQDPGEPGLSGVTLDLVEAGGDGTFGTADDVPIGSDVTDGTGTYGFSGLPPGLYRVTVNGATVPPGMALTTGNLPFDQNLGPAQVVDTADFGYRDQGGIGDVVFDDANGNGVQDPGELGLPGVTLDLVEAGVDGVLGTGDDVAVGSDLTDGTGAYGFANLPPGLYRVTVDGATVPAGMALTTGNLPFDQALAPAQVVDTADFGYRHQGAIGDLVFDDVNGNGVQDPGEPGLAGVTLDLVEAGVDGTFGTPDDVAIGSDVTDGTGAYGFSFLPPGLYRVTVDGATLPAGMGLTTGNLPFDVTLAPAQVIDTADFGYVFGGSIGDLVFDDVNGNGVQDPGEPGLVGVTLDLVEAGVDGVLGTGDDVPVGSVVTDGTGTYGFTGLPPGLYRVTVNGATVPPGMALTTGNQPLDVSLAPGQTVDMADFGYRHQGVIGDVVFDDVNGNGAQDPGEPGLAGVTLDLVEAGVDGVLGTGDDVAVGSDLTDGTGAYAFANLPPGLYQVTVDPASLPAGVTLTTGNVPFSVNLTPAQVVDTADFGYQLPLFTVGDVIWIDSDEDGVYEPVMGEAPVPGVLVTLYDAGGAVVATDVTNAAGEYRFTVPAGTYRVEVDPSNFAPGGALEGMLATTTGVTVTAVIASDNFDLDFAFAVAAPIPQQYCQWWQINAAQWPLQSLVIGGQNMSQAQAMAILSQGNILEASFFGRYKAQAIANADMSVLLAWALIGAKLNVGSGNDYSAIEPTILAAETWLTGAGIGSGITSRHQQYYTANALYQALNAWNRGQ